MFVRGLLYVSSISVSCFYFSSQTSGNGGEIYSLTSDARKYSPCDSVISFKDLKRIWSVFDLYFIHKRQWSEQKIRMGLLQSKKILNTGIKSKLHTLMLVKAYIKMMYIFSNVNYIFVFPWRFFFLYASKWNALKLCNRYARQWSGEQLLLCANRHWNVTGGLSVNLAIVMPYFGFI